MDSSAQLLAGRPHGGLGILWRKSLGEKCNIIDLDDTRFLGIEISINSNGDEIKLLFVNIYMPFDCADHAYDFTQYLSRVNDIFKSYPTPYVYVIGDLNANVIVKNNQCSSIFGETLLKFCEDEAVVLADYEYLPMDSYTFISSAHNTVSWLDHILTTSTGQDLIEHIDVANNFVSSDHLPISLLLNCKCFHVMGHDEFNFIPRIPPLILLPLMDIVIKPPNCCVILLLIMTCLFAMKFHVINQVINYLSTICI
jgi:hypothetical protein